jgi:hypothetical protein
MVGMVLERGIDGINGQLPGGNNKDKLRRVVTATCSPHNARKYGTRSMLLARSSGLLAVGGVVR